MPAFGTRFGTRFPSSALGTKWPADASSAASQLILDAMSALGYSSPAAYSVSHKLRSAQTYAFQVIRASDSTTLDIGFTAGNVVDETAISTFCSGTTGKIVTVYDQSGNSRDITQSTDSRRPVIYTGGAVTKRGSLVCSTHTNASGGGGAGIRWSRGDVLGLSLTPTVATFVVAKYGSIATNDRVISAIGGNGGQSIAMGAMPTGDLAIGISNFGLAVGSATRIFTAAASITAATHHYLYSVAQRGFVPSFTVRQDGTMLVQSSPGSLALTNNNGTTYGFGSYGSSGDKGFDGLNSTVIHFSRLPTSTALSTLMTFGDGLVALAEGSPPSAPDLTTYAPRYVISTGQSNSAFLPIPAVDPTARYGTIWRKSSTAATGFGNGTGGWVPGNTQYNNLRNEILALDPNIPIDLWWALGETDGGSSTNANSFAAQFLAMEAQLRTDTGRNFNHCWNYLHTDALPNVTFGTTINSQITTIVSTLGARGAVFDPTSAGSLSDTLHWGPDASGGAGTTTQQNCINTAHSLITSTWPLVGHI